VTLLHTSKRAVELVEIAPGTYYGVIKATTTGSCVASSTIAVPAATWTQTGFPHG
jgi:hypothetical protein